MADPHPLAMALRGRPIVLLGAHYDSWWHAAGADDNASGVAAMLEVSRLLAGRRLPRTVRFVAFSNEEEFQDEAMGSLAHARRARARGDRLSTVVVLDSVGYYDDAPGSQSWPFPLGPFLTDRASFVAVVSNTRSRRAVLDVTAALRRHSPVPVVGGAVPVWIAGVDWSDHWSFWQAGYPAVLLTDMPPYRNPHYHEPSDRPETLDMERLAGLAEGLAAMVAELAGAQTFGP